VPELAGIWQRATAFLARQALESVVREALDRRVPGASKASARAQLLCLPTYASTAVAHDAGYLWGALSRACHQHSYELAPTWEELADWLGGVERVAERLQTTGPGSQESGSKSENGTSDELP
jgi:cytochrome c5